jgi:hypothetical protein
MLMPFYFSSLPFIACYYACRRRCCHPDSPTPTIGDFFRRFCGVVPAAVAANQEEFDRLADQVGRRVELFLLAQLQRLNLRSGKSTKGGKNSPPNTSTFQSVAAQTSDVEANLGEDAVGDQEEY